MKNNTRINGYTIEVEGAFTVFAAEGGGYVIGVRVDEVPNIDGRIGFSPPAASYQELKEHCGTKSHVRIETGLARGHLEEVAALRQRVLELEALAERLEDE